MIKEYFFDENKFVSYSINQSRSLTNLSQVNIFIGPNNSGKSRFLRELYNDDDSNVSLHEIDFDKIEEIVQKYIYKIEYFYQKYNIKDVILSNNFPVYPLERLNTIKKKKELNRHNVKEYLDSFEDLYETLINPKKPEIQFKPSGSKFGNPSDTEIITFLVDIGQKFSSEINSILPTRDFNFSKIYIPILRGLRPIQMLGVNENTQFENALSDNYKKRTLKDYFDITKDDDTIFTGLSLYQDIKRLLLNTRDNRLIIKDFEDFLSKFFFNCEPISLIPHIDNDVLCIGIGNEEERRIYDLGDGIQAIITMIYPLFINKGKDALIFIEEPETHLHPGMQRVFIEALLREEFSSFQYFITTHSNHLLDITLDMNNISVFSFAKNSALDEQTVKFDVNSISAGDIRVLDLIGVRNSSIFMSNCTIWVEGITDRLYLRKYLDIYQQMLIDSDKINVKFKEDLHFSFIEYGGANITHWSFSNTENWEKICAAKISNRIFLIADEDNTEETPESKKAQRLKELRENLKDNFYVLKAIEIENTLSASVILKTIAKYEKCTIDDFKFNSDFSIEHYKNEKIGKYITNTINNLKKKYNTESGTLNNKVAFCKAALEEINTYDDLSQEAKKIAKKLFEFIGNNNRNLETGMPFVISLVLIILSMSIV